MYGAAADEVDAERATPRYNQLSKRKILVGTWDA